MGGAVEGVTEEEEEAASGRGEAGALVEAVFEEEGFDAMAAEEALLEDACAAEAAVIGAVLGVRGAPLTFVLR